MKFAKGVAEIGMLVFLITLGALLVSAVNFGSLNKQNVKDQTVNGTDYTVTTNYYPNFFINGAGQQILLEMLLIGASCIAFLAGEHSVSDYEEIIAERSEAAGLEASA
jgi:hypothetical protein